MNTDKTFNIQCNTCCVVEMVFVRTRDKRRLAARRLSMLALHTRPMRARIMMIPQRSVSFTVMTNESDVDIGRIGRKLAKLHPNEHPFKATARRKCKRSNLHSGVQSYRAEKKSLYVVW